MALLHVDSAVAPPRLLPSLRCLGPFETAVCGAEDDDLLLDGSDLGTLTGSKDGWVVRSPLQLKLPQEANPQRRLRRPMRDTWTTEASGSYPSGNPRRCAGPPRRVCVQFRQRAKERRTVTRRASSGMDRTNPTRDSRQCCYSRWIRSGSATAHPPQRRSFRLLFCRSRPR